MFMTMIGRMASEHDHREGARPPEVVEIEHFLIHAIRDHLGPQRAVGHDVDEVEDLEDADDVAWSGTTTTVDFISGRTIRKKIWTSLAPSSLAASMSDSGMLLRLAENRTMANPARSQTTTAMRAQLFRDFSNSHARG